MTSGDIGHELRRRWRPEISLGNVLQIGAMVVGLAVGWTQLRADQDAMRSEFERRVSTLEAISKERANRDLQQVQMLAEMQADLRYVRAQLDRLERPARTERQGAGD